MPDISLPLTRATIAFKMPYHTNTVTHQRKAFSSVRDTSRFSGKNTPPDSPKIDLDYHPHMANFPEFGPPPFNAEFHADRRRAFLAKLPPNTTVIIPGAQLKPRNGDVDFTFRQESNFYYLTGFDEPDAVAILSNVPNRPTFTLIVPPRDPQQETWTGRRAGVSGAREKYRADSAFENTKLKEVIQDHARHGGQIQCIPTVANQEADRRIQSILNQNATWSQKAKNTLKAVYNRIKTLHPFIEKLFNQVETFIAGEITQPSGPSQILDEMRLIKTPYELALLKRACDISAKGHIRAMQKMQLNESEMQQQPHRHLGRNEGEIQAKAEYHFRRHGAVRQGYDTIAGGGANACVLHYNTNREFAKPGDLELVDAGAEYGYYTADITRTWPISGKFSPEQKAIYDLVLKAQESGIRMTRPGVSMADIHKNSVQVITQGLMALGILKGDPTNPQEVAQNIQNNAYRKYFMHGTSHMLGMDVHDVPLGSSDIRQRPLAPGMFFTIEPGIYIDPEVAKQEGLDPKWAGIGVRIEDDILVTEQACENFSDTIPRTTEAIEALMAQGRKVAAPNVSHSI
jgi:Xaa-Pro aminopeptidase